MRLLVLIGLATAAIFVGVDWSSPPATSGYHVGGYVYLNHPTGFPPTNAILSCGWHSNCDGDHPDAELKATDWTWPNSSHSVYLRLRAIGNENTACCKIYSDNHWWGPCLGVRNRVVHPTYGTPVKFGEVRTYHTVIASSTVTTFYFSTSGTNNWTYIGEFIDDDDDPCSGYDHAHQYYESGPYDTVWGKNAPPRIPDEETCHRWSNPRCGIAYDSWTTPEYVFGIDLMH